MSLCLSPSELKEVTRKVKPSAQAKVLNHMGIKHAQRPDGTIVVLTETAMQRFGEVFKQQTKRPIMGMVR